MNGSLQLSEYPGDLVRLSCEECGRSGQYRKQKLIERSDPNHLSLHHGMGCYSVLGVFSEVNDIGNT